MKKTPLESWTDEKIKPYSQLRSYQLAKLKETVGHAKAHSPFYRWRLAGYCEEDIGSLEDFKSLPFTTGADLATDPLRFLAVSQDEIKRIVTLETSGTTGLGKRVFFTEADLESTIDFFQWGMSTLVERGDKVLILLPGERPGGVGDLLAQGLSKMGATPIPHGPITDFGQMAALITRKGITSLVGIPTQVLGLARYIEALSPTFQSPLRSTLLTTDYVSPALLNFVENIFTCRVFNHYGMTEMGFGGGVDCAARGGFHLREVDLYWEIVDPTTGTPVSPGTRGEIVFSTLTRRGMPLIRYKTGDEAHFVAESCPCRTYLQRIAYVKDRLPGRIALPEGDSLSLSQLDDILFSLPHVADFDATVYFNATNVGIELILYLPLPPPTGFLHQTREAVLGTLPSISQLFLEARVITCPRPVGKRMLKWGNFLLPTRN